MPNCFSKARIATHDVCSGPRLSCVQPNNVRAQMLQLHHHPDTRNHATVQDILPKQASFKCLACFLPIPVFWQFFYLMCCDCILVLAQININDVRKTLGSAPCTPLARIYTWRAQYPSFVLLGTQTKGTYLRYYVQVNQPALFTSGMILLRFTVQTHFQE